jgi:hypothetical protein
VKLIQVKIGTLPGDVMGLLRKRKFPKVGDMITLRHVGHGSHGKKDIIVKVVKVSNGRVFCSSWSTSEFGRSYNNEHIKGPLWTGEPA